MDEFENYIKQESLDSERQVLHGLSHMWTLAFNFSCVCMYFHMCVCMQSFICVYVDMHMCSHVCMHACAYACIDLKM